jgi:hypothetical protein
MTPWYQPEEHPSILDDLHLHKEQVAHAAFLLGYAYFEAFVSDLIWIIYRYRPRFLPSDGSLAYGTVLSADSLEEVLEKMIDQTTGSMNSLQRKLEHLGKQPFGIGRPCPSLVQESHVARNTLIHNSGRINRIPKGHARWKAGDAISLDCGESYEFC